MEPSTMTRELAGQLATLEQQAGEVRAHLRAAILKDLRRGVRQADLVRATGYTRDWLRQLARADAAGKNSARRPK